MFTFSVYFFLSCGYLFPTDEVIDIVKRLPDSLNNGTRFRVEFDRYTFVALNTKYGIWETIVTGATAF